MSMRLPAYLPKSALLALVALLGTAGLTFAAEQQVSTTTTPAPTVTTVQQRATLVVPDLTGQAFVFAKGVLQDTGFAWRVVGGVRGFAANVVVAQSPVAGTRVYDTGAPLVKVTLKRNSKYGQDGSPQDISPYRATALDVYSASPAVPVAPAAPATTTTAETTPAAPAATTEPATTTTAAASPEVAPHANRAVAAYPQNRPAAFAVAGAPKEPLDEMPLPVRAHALERWLVAHPKPTDANVRHWLYQNQWIVSGARFGWWRGAEALQILVAVDRRAAQQWGIGSKSEAMASAALSEVEAGAR
jgi:hypothetical protein